MGQVLVATEVVSALLALSLNAVQAAQQIQTLLATAHAQNRDLTDDEMKTVISARHTVENAIIAHLKGVSTP